MTVYRHEIGQRVVKGYMEVVILNREADMPGNGWFATPVEAAADCAQKLEELADRLRWQAGNLVHNERNRAYR
jgi:hypothetical protein